MLGHEAKKNDERQKPQNEGGQRENACVNRAVETKPSDGHQPFTGVVGLEECRPHGSVTPKPWLVHLTGFADEDIDRQQIGICRGDDAPTGGSEQ